MAVIGKHNHSYVADPSGNGATSYDLNHRHKIKEGVVQDAEIPGREGSLHTHNISGIKVQSSQPVVNIKLKNYATANSYKYVPINLGPISEVDTETSQANIASSAVAPTFPMADGIFLEFNSAIELEGSARFAFDIDIERALRKSHFASIFDNNLEAGTKNEILSLTTIASLEIKRRRIDVATADEPIVSSKQIAVGGLLSPELNEIKIKQDMSSIKVGSISEVTMNYGSPIRTFTGVDYSLPEEGVYEYGAKIDLNDGIISYLNKKLSGLTAAVSSAQEWESFSSPSEYTDPATGRFTSEYEARVLSDYGASLTPIESSIATYSSILSVLSPDIDSVSVIKVLYPLVNVQSGSTKGINMVLELLQDLESKLRNILGHSSSVGQTNTEKTSITTKDKYYSNKIEIEKFFCNSQVNPTNKSKIGYDFLALESTNNYGLKTISTEGYDIRITSELNKFSSSEIVSLSEDDISLIDDEGKSTSLENLTISQATFLTAENVYAGSDKLNLQMTDNTRWDPSIYSEVSLQIEMANIIKNSGTVNSAGISGGILSLLGISVEKYGEQSSSTLAGTTSVDEANYFSDGDAFVGDNMVEDEILENESSPELSEEQDSMLSSLAASLLGSTEGSIANNPAYYDFESSENLLYKMTTLDVQNIPLQIKSLFLPGQSGIKSISDDTSLDSLDLIPLFLFNYNQIAQIEYLSYKLTKMGTRQSAWSPLTTSKMQQSSKSPVRCRVKRYANSNLYVEPSPDLEAPIFDNHFIIAGSGVNMSKTKRSRQGSVEKKAYAFVSNQNKIFRSGKKVFISTKTPSIGVNSSLSIK